MKNLLLLNFIILLCSSNLIGQSSSEVYRIVEGGTKKINIDTKTDLETLILKLENDWELEMTGKRYWIGYTDLMYSIASRKEEAIKPLTDFYNSTSTENGKFGVLYTLHLIGIESNITGRFTESFVNSKARKTILEFVYSKNEKIRDLSIELLMRDPWQSDVPILMDAMQKSINDSWTIVNALIRYIDKDAPIQNEINDSLKQRIIEFKTPDDICDKEFIPNILKSIKSNLSESVYIEKELFKQNLNGYSCTGFQSGRFGELIKDITNNNVFNYCSLGYKVQYYVEDNKVYICSSETAKKRWLDWWKNRQNDWNKK
ncbi:MULTISPECIES: hypothetical protein [Mesonia]|uniref:Uncharacterized protein n=1 Tax=Mesonia oceanica TaxID=2687242 RepID=A0AC61Y3W3_9FLAO|nr:MULTISPECIES: hypothetical protein [Mesonia]MAN28747.1 hypothetical protein [Mesonia sp.]MAQ41922.1 hypothetical protein [Mesonia sp.]VVU99151.1 hypothetical protein FVB9532_00403 [Mesonia oceanica]